MRRLVLATDPAITPEAQQKTCDHLTSLGVYWWHHIGNVWLLVDRQKRIRLEALMNDVRAIGGNALRVVITEAGEAPVWWGGAS